MKEAITAAAAAACGRSEAATAAAPPSQAPSQAASSLGGPVQSCIRTQVLVVVLASEPARWEAPRRRSIRLARAHRLRGVAASAAAPNSAMGVWLEPHSQPFPFRRAQSAKALYKSNRVAATTREACGRAVPRRRLHRASVVVASVASASASAAPAASAFAASTAAHCYRRPQLLRRRRPPARSGRCPLTPLRSSPARTAQPVATVSLPVLSVRCVLLSI